MTKGTYEFGRYRLLPDKRVLQKDGTDVPLSSRAFDILRVLAQHAGNRVSHDALIEEVWRDASVSYDNVRQQVSQLRRAFGTDGAEYIKTIPNFGYQLAVDAVWVEESDAGPPTPAATAPGKRARAAAGIGLVLATLVLGMLVAGLARVRVKQVPPESRLPAGRLLARATSESAGPDYFPLSYFPNHLAISNDGSVIFAASDLNRTLSIIRTYDRTSSAIQLPRPAGPMAVARDGTLYIASPIEGIMVVSPKSGFAGALRQGVIQTHGPVHSLAITPDGAKIFLAMAHSGVKRLFTESRALDLVTDRVCPESLTLDRQGKRLYVAYQCSGPTGRQGHDSVEIFDVETEKSLGLISGPPMVGSDPAISPDGRLVILDGGGACSRPGLDHQGCPVIPSHVFHMFRAADRQILHTMGYPTTQGGAAHFIDNSRFLVTGAAMEIYDAASYAALERFGGEGHVFLSPVFSPKGDAVYAGSTNPMGVVKFRPEGEGCSPPAQGLASLYPADGTFDDIAASWNLTPRGPVGFAPGRIGQAFSFDGKGYLTTSSLGHYDAVIGSQDMSFGFYTKLADAQGGQVLLHWTARGAPGGMRLALSEDSRFMFQSLPGNIATYSKTVARPGTWYLITVTRKDNEFTLYVNGVAEGSQSADAVAGAWLSSLAIGAETSGRAAFRGWIDDLMFYARALGAKDIHDQFELREQGPCKM